jgi:hypothetical protein
MPETPPNRKHDLNDDDEEAESGEFDPQEYDTLMQLERLESLEEEMIEVGVTTLDELRERIARLHHTLDTGQ